MGSHATIDLAGDRLVFADRVLSALDSGVAPIGWPVIPYPGVRHFLSDEETIFFGRNDDVSNIRIKLSREHCVFVLGGSGAGKSSLVRAGLIPRLVAGNPLDDRWGPWYTLTFSPGTNAFESLARSLVTDIYAIKQWPPSMRDAASVQTLSSRRTAAAARSLERIAKRCTSGQLNLSNAQHVEDLEKKLSELIRGRYENDGEGLAEFLFKEIDRFHADFAGIAASGTSSLIVIIDQFEEIFRDNVNPRGVQAIIRMMASFDSRKCPGFYVIATMRSEEVYRSVDYPELTGLIDRTAHFVDLPGSNEIFKAITSSARTVIQLAGFDNPEDVGIETSVAERLLDAVEALAVQRAQRADQLPLLQNALRELWGHAARRWKDDPTSPLAINNRDLERLPSIVESGGIPDLAACLNRMADKAFKDAIASFSDTVAEHDSTELLEVAFVCLEQPDDRGNSARAFATVDDILAAYGRSWPNIRLDLQRALQIFVKRTILRYGGGGAARQVFDLSHESVIRNWGVYIRWVEEAYGIRRVISRVLEDVWDKQPHSGLPTRFEQGQWTPKLTIGECRELISPYQSEILQSVRIRRTNYWFSFTLKMLITSLGWIGRVLVSFAGRARGEDYAPAGMRPSSARPNPECIGPAHLECGKLKPKLSEKWLTVAILPMFERRLKRWKQVSIKEVNDIGADEISKITNWFIGMVDKARIGHRLRSLGMVSVVASGVGVVILVLSFHRVVSALQGQQAISVLGSAASDRAKQWDAEARARVILYSYSAIDAASNEFGASVSNRMAEAVLTLFNMNSQELFKQLTAQISYALLDRTARSSLGRNFIITPAMKIGHTPLGSCLVVPEAKTVLSVLPVEPILPGEREEDDKAISKQRIFSISPNSIIFLTHYNLDGPTSISLNEEVESDLQITLPANAQLCLSSDGTILTESSPGQSFPDLYELQWTLCVRNSGCKNEGRRKWRVRHIPIDYASGPYSLPPQTFPRVNAIEMSSNGKVQVYYTATKIISGIPVDDAGCTTGQEIGTSDDQSCEYVAEFYTELAVPRSVIKSPEDWKSLRECENGACNIKVGEKAEVSIQIRRRPDGPEKEPSVLEIDVIDQKSGAFAASKMTIPATKIDRAGLTESGEVLLYEADSTIGWKFVGSRGIGRFKQFAY
jgi:hypothetical protein